MPDLVEGLFDVNEDRATFSVSVETCGDVLGKSE